MRLRIPGRLDHGLQLKNNLDRIRSILGLSFHDWADFLQVPTSKHSKLLEGKFEISAVALETLALQLGLSYEKLVTGDIDYTALNNWKSASQALLPERYSVVANSKRRTSIHLLKCVEFIGGRELKRRLLRHCQVSEDSFQDPDLKINILFLTDVCDWLASNGVSHSELYAFGRSSFEQNRDTELGQRLGRMRTITELLEYVFYDCVSTYYDQNFYYYIDRLHRNSMTVKAIPRLEVAEGLARFQNGSLLVGSSQVCTAKAGSFSSLSGYIQQPFMNVKEERCIHRGDSYCKFVFDF